MTDTNLLGLNIAFEFCETTNTRKSGSLIIHKYKGFNMN